LIREEGCPVFFADIGILAGYNNSILKDNNGITNISAV